MIPIWLALIILAIIMLVELMVMVIVFCTKYPIAGRVVIDIRRTATDSIYVESPKNLKNWEKYKALRFDVEIKHDVTNTPPPAKF